MIVSQENILSVIPQRPPFVMIDQLVSCDPVSSCTLFRVREGNILVSGGELTEAGLIENIAQTAAAGLGYITKNSGAEVQIGYIGAIKNLEITALPKVGDMIKTEVAIINQVFDVSIVSAKVATGGVEFAKCEMKIFIKN